MQYLLHKQGGIVADWIFNWLKGSVMQFGTKEMAVAAGEKTTFWEIMKKFLTGESAKEFLTPANSMWGNVKKYAFPTILAAQTMGDKDKGWAQKLGDITISSFMWPLWGTGARMIPLILGEHLVKKVVDPFTSKLDKVIGDAPKPKIPTMRTPSQMMPPTPGYGV